MEWSFRRYLSAKKSVDDRALNRQVWEALKTEIQHKSARERIRVLELGMGIGTMLQRALEWGLFNAAEYIGVDAEAENIENASQLIPEWAKANGWALRPLADDQNSEDDCEEIAYCFMTMDLFEFLQQDPWRNHFDLVIANAVLDLVDIKQVLPMIRDCLKQDGIGYFSINFDGETVFEPVLDETLEKQIIGFYHQSMDERQINGQPSGDSRSGRHLYHTLKQSGFEVLEVGASDWVVYSREGRYPQDEAYFLHFILHFFEETLQKYPQIKPADLEHWLSMRRSQVENGELFYLAHQLDYLVRKV